MPKTWRCELYMFKYTVLMFFILSKILFFVIQPLNWVIGLMAFSLLIKKPVWKKRALLAALIMTLFFSNRWLFNQVARAWEVKTITADQITVPYDIGILLGGYSNPHVRPSHDRLNLSTRGNRFMNAYELYRTGKVKKLLLTGGSGDPLQQQPSEAIEVKKYLIRIGIPEEDIIIEPRSRNTYENAAFTKEILDNQFPAGVSCLLITSAWHMRRSVGCFKKAGVTCEPFSVDFLTEKNRWAPENTLIPDRNGFGLWEYIIKEWIGYAAYWLKGYV